MTKEFIDPVVQRRWEDWQKRLDRALAGLPAVDRRELRAEIRGHALEAFAAADGSDEGARLNEALARVGDPSLFLGMLTRTRSMVDPAKLARGTYATLRSAGRWGYRGLLTAFALAFAAITLLKLATPGQVGLFREPSGQIEFGFVAYPQGTELLGLAIVPLTAVIAGGLGWLVWRECVRASAARLG